MAVKKTVEIDVETNSDSAIKQIVDLFNTLVDEQKKADKNQNDLNDNVEELGKVAKKSEKGINSISKGFKGVGLAIKTAGIGLVISLLGTLKEILFSNQKVLDAFSTGLEAITIVFNQVIDSVDRTIESVSKSTDGFDALGKVLKGLLTIGLAPLKLTFFAIQKGINEAQLAWEKSFFGDKNQATIDELNLKLTEVNNNITNTAKDTANAGKDIVNNFSEAVSEVGELGEAVIDEVSKVSIKAGLEQAKQNVNLKNSAEIAQAQQSLLIEQYDRQAEKLRQTRDNDLKSIDEREEANNKLLDVLNKQEKAMLAEADAIIASASAQLKKSKTTENEVALLEAQANKAGVLAQIEGFRSEQDVNRNALIKERLELEQSGLEATEQRNLREKEFRAEQESDEIRQLELKKQLLAEEKKIEEERLQLKIDSYVQGTQARLDAENELKDRLQEIQQQDEELRTSISQKNAEARIKILDLEAKAKEQNLDVSSKVAAEASDLLGKNTAAGKVAGIASATISTYLSAQKAYASQLIPGDPSSVARATVSAGLAITAGLKNVKEILKVKTPSGSGGGSTPSSPSSPSTPQAPAFNLVGSSGTNQIEETIQQEQTPIQAVVVSGAVTSAQEADRNAIDSATLG